MHKLTLIIPAKKERESLPTVLKELENLNIKILVVLEKSDIETINAIKNFDCEILYQNGKGYGDALIQGIKSTKTDFFCIFNADGSFLKSELKEMYDYLDNDKSDLVFGSRYMDKGSSEDDTIITYIGNKIFTFLGNFFFSLNISDILYTYVMGKTKHVISLNLIEKKFSFCVELPIKAKKSNLRLLSIPSYERARIGGKKKVSAFKDGFLILVSMIKLYFSSKSINK